MKTKVLISCRVTEQVIYLSILPYALADILGTFAFAYAEAGFLMIRLNVRAITTILEVSKILKNKFSTYYAAVSQACLKTLLTKNSICCCSNLYFNSIVPLLCYLLNTYL